MRMQGKRPDTAYSISIIEGEKSEKIEKSERIKAVSVLGPWGSALRQISLFAVCAVNHRNGFGVNRRKQCTTLAARYRI